MRPDLATCLTLHTRNHLFFIAVKTNTGCCAVWPLATNVFRLAKKKLML